MSSGTHVYVGNIVESSGHHGLSCKRSCCRTSRHQAANETIRRALVPGGIPAVLDLFGVCKEDGKRPNSMSLIPWKEGRHLLCDFTCSDTMAPSHKHQAASGPNELACTAESVKICKYSSLTSTYTFAPVCIETMCTWG